MQISKAGDTQPEQMFSGLPPITDIAGLGRHGRKVPILERATNEPMVREFNFDQFTLL
jgi:hypothetical protein